MSLVLTFIAAVCVSLLATLAIAASPAPLPEVIDVIVVPPVTGPGEPVTVEANVHNPLEGDADFSVVVLVDDVPEQEQTVRLPAGATRTLRFTVIRSEPGAHVVRVGTQATTFQVLSPQIIVQDLIIEPAFATPGQPVILRATVINLGAAPGIFEVPLTVNGALMEFRSGLLKAGQSKTVAFQVTDQASGSYTALMGGLPGSFTVASPSFEVILRPTIGISRITTSASNASGANIPVTGDSLTLSTSSDSLEVTLPAAIPPRQLLGEFFDLVSGITYKDSSLVIPLRDLAYKEVARLEVTSPGVTGLGDEVRVSSTDVRLIIPTTPLRLPASTLPLESLAFGLDIPVRGLVLDMPLRFTPGLRPAEETVADMELAAREQGLTIAQVLGAATIEAPIGNPDVPEGTATAAFSAPSSWVESVSVSNIGIIHVDSNGNVELSPIVETLPANGQTILKARFGKASGTFVLVQLDQGGAVGIDAVVLPSPVTVLDTPVEVVALVNTFEGTSDTTNAILRINNGPVAVSQVQSLGDGSGVATFFVTVGSPGTHNLDIEGAKGQLSAGLKDVASDAQVFRFNVSQEKATPGQLVEVIANVGNVGPTTIVPDLIITVNGAPTEQLHLAIPGGEFVETVFGLTVNQRGVYNVALLNALSTVTVTTEPTPASFQVTDLEVRPLTVEPGEPVTVMFTVTNSGEQPGIYAARGYLNGREDIRQQLEVDGLTRLPVSISVVPSGEGIFTLEVAGLRRDFVVVSSRQRSDLALETINIDPQTVAGSDPVTVSVKLRNRSNQEATGIVTVLVNDQQVIQREVRVGPSGNSVETFVLSQATPGLYLVEVRQGASPEVATDVLRGEFLVTRERTPASWEIARLEVVPQPVGDGEPITVNFLVSNLGQQSGDLSVIVSIDGVPEVERVVQVGPETTQQISLPLAGRAEGTYTVDVNGVTTPFTVSALSQEPGLTITTTPPAVVAENSQNGWLLAITASVVLAALVGGGYGLFRWRRTRVSAE